MEVKNREVDGKIIVDVSGDVDMKTSRLLQKSLKELVGAKISPIIVNLEKVSYMDSSGLATLVECLQGVRTYKGQLRLFGLSQNLKEVFKIVKLDSIFSIFSSENDALAK